MAGSTNAPFGLRPIRHWAGNPWNGATRVLVDVGSTALYIGDPVYRKVVDAGETSGKYLGCDILTGADVTAADNQLLGVITSRAGRVVNGQLQAPTDLNTYTVASETGSAINCVVDMSVCFLVQNNASGTEAYTWCGKNTDLVSGSGSTTTGLSGWAFKGSSAAADSSSGCLIVGLWDDPLNVATDAYGIWELLITIPYIALGGYSATTGVLGL